MVQQFCRHNRFIQRCPICRETLPGYAPTPRRAAKTGGKGAGEREAAGTRSGASRAAGAGARSGLRGIARTSGRSVTEVRVRRETRARDDGYRCELVPGLRSSLDASRLVREIAFASGRLLTLTAAPPALYAEARDECEDIEQATWMCFLAAYLSPLQGAKPFAGIRQALTCSWASGAVPDLEDVPLGPRTSHDPTRGSETVVAYRRFAEHAGSQERAFGGEAAWSPQRRFQRVFERLALPGFGRTGRFDLLITLGRLGLYELRADSLHLSGVSVRGPADVGDPVLQAAKRVFGIGDPLNIERRALALAEAISTPVEALDLALWNWSRMGDGGEHGEHGDDGEERTTLGFSAGTFDEHASERAAAALEL